MRRSTTSSRSLPRLGYLEAAAHRELSGLYTETSKVLAGLLRALRQ